MKKLWGGGLFHAEQLLRGMSYSEISKRTKRGFTANSSISEATVSTVSAKNLLKPPKEPDKTRGRENAIKIAPSERHVQVISLPKDYSEGDMRENWKETIRRVGLRSWLRPMRLVLLKDREIGEGKTRLIVASSAIARYLRNADRQRFSEIPPASPTRKEEKKATRRALLRLAITAAVPTFAYLVNELSRVSTKRTERRRAVREAPKVIIDAEEYRNEGLGHFHTWALLNHFQRTYELGEFRQQDFSLIEEAARTMGYHPLVLAEAAARYGKREAELRRELQNARGTDKEILERFSASLDKMRKQGMHSVIDRFGNQVVPEVFDAFQALADYRLESYGYNIIMEGKKKIRKGLP